MAIKLSLALDDDDRLTVDVPVESAQSAEVIQRQFRAYGRLVFRSLLAAATRSFLDRNGRNSDIPVGWNTGSGLPSSCTKRNNSTSSSEAVLPY